MAFTVVRHSYNFMQQGLMKSSFRCLASQSNLAINNKSYGNNFELRFVKEGQRPLVLLFSWMLAKQKHIDKYSNFYLSRGCDVLTVKLRPMQVLSPKVSQSTMAELANVLQELLKKKQKLLVHGFSVGGYVFSELLVQINQNPEKHSEIRKSLVGQIFDSPVDYDGVARGFANVLTENIILKKILNDLIAVYLKLSQAKVMHHYLKASDAFKKNELKLPTLMLYSESDPIGCAKIIQSVIEDWKQRKEFPVYSKSWENSPHVSHFHKHPDEYIDMLLMFLQSCKLLKDDMATAAEDIETKEVKARVEN